MNLKTIKTPGWILITVVFFGLIWGAKTIVETYFPKSSKDVVVAQINDFPPLSYDKNSKGVPLRKLPSSDVASVQSEQIRCELMDWHAQLGFLYSNGGPQTTKGSLIEDGGLNVKVTVQNDCNKQGADLLAFCQDYKTNNHSPKGCQIIAWMGDANASYFQSLNKQIVNSVGPDFIVQVFYVTGSSFGEDKLMGQQSWKQNPQAARGSLISGVIRDGDWNVAMKWAGDNNIPVNNDLTGFDPDAINWIGADDYLKAVDAYIAGKSETRKIITHDKNGKSHKTTRDTTVAINGVVTWTPGDINAVSKKGGLVTIASTKDYSAQMPCTFIACKKWLQDNRQQVEKLILAGSLGGDQVKSHESALEFAAKVGHEVFGDLTAQDRVSYYKGKQVTDKQGNINEIGGSRVWNLNDNADYFGLSGGADKYKMVYETFGNLCMKSYPEDVPRYPSYDSVVDLSYLNDVYSQNKNNTSMAAASTTTFKEGATISQKVSNQSLTIEFDLGSANIRQSSVPNLKKLAASIAIEDNLMVSIDGYTDNTGNQESNVILSNNRANAIKNWLVSYNSKTFGGNRITANGHGPENPIGDNNTDAGRQKNRRVELTAGR